MPIVYLFYFADIMLKQGAVNLYIRLTAPCFSIKKILFVIFSMPLNSYQGFDTNGLVRLPIYNQHLFRHIGQLFQG